MIRALLPIFALGFASVLDAAEAPKSTMKVTPLAISEQWSLPWEEISGIKLFGGELYVASDSAQDLGRYPWRAVEKGAKRLDLVAGESRTLTLVNLNAEGKKKKKAKRQKKSQWEAVTLDKGGSVFLIKESKDQLVVYEASGQAGRVYKLGAYAGRKNQNKGFEGLTLLKGGHFLVALTSPSVLIEYGPEGDKALGAGGKQSLPDDEAFSLPKGETLVPLHSWKLTQESGCEFSDLAQSKSGEIYALLKDCNRIIQVPELRTDKEDFASIQSWTLPQGVPHPEGLEALGDEGFLVASDVRAIETNLFWLKANP